MDDTKLVAEIRADFQLPPYLDDVVVQRALVECRARLLSLYPDADFDKDNIGRKILKSAVYYSLNHRYEEFELNYNSLILSWQLGAKVNESK